MSDQTKKVEKLYNYAIKRGYHVPELYRNCNNPKFQSYFEVFLLTAFGKPINKITKRDLDWLLDGNKD